jgi:hypothetical protein
MFDELFEGTPEGRFFDILSVANQNLVKDELINIIEKLAVCEILLEKHGVENIDSSEIKSYIINNQDKVDEVKNNIYIHSMTEIVSKNE